MPYQYEATSNFEYSMEEVETLLTLATEDDENQELFLKLAAVSSVTKFQVFVEEILGEFRYELNGKISNQLSTYIKLNSLRISLEGDNPLVGVKTHKNFTDKKKNNIVKYLQSIKYITNEDSEIGESFKLKTQYPMGKTGKKELVDLLKQIDGEGEPFAEFGNEKFDTLDSILNTRHGIVHHDRFNGTEHTVRSGVVFLKELVVYIDQFLANKMSVIEKNGVE